jgi:hypothetical protein
MAANSGYTPTGQRYVPPNPQQNYRKNLSNYQYNVMARNPSAMSIRTQTRYYNQRETQYGRRMEGPSTGNVYSANKWRGGARGGSLSMLGRYDPYAVQRRKMEGPPTAGGYWGNKLIQRQGGDKSTDDRLGWMLSRSYYGGGGGGRAVWDSIANNMMNQYSQWQSGKTFGPGGLI